MINSKQRARLKSIASKYDAIFQIGKDGIKETLINQINDALNKRELVKISVLDSSHASAKELAHPMADFTQSDLVQVIGNKIILYKPNRKNPVISDEIRKLK